jgi:hypothetical protein
MTKFSLSSMVTVSMGWSPPLLSAERWAAYVPEKPC